MSKCLYNKYPECHKECRHWINYEKDQNCLLKSVEDNGPMTLEEVAKRMEISYVRVKQIEDAASKKVIDLLEFYPELKKELLDKDDESDMN